MNEQESIERLKERGYQARLAYRLKLPRSTVNEIFNGKRRATLRQAAELEAEFTKRSIPLNRWDLLYGIQEGQPLVDYLAARAAENREV